MSSVIDNALDERVSLLRVLFILDAVSERNWNMYASCRSESP